MDRTLGEWGRKGRGHWVNGVEEENDNEPEWKKAQRWADKKRGIKECAE